MRVFIGIALPAGMKRALTALQKELKKEIRADWSREENYHITLNFIGEADRKAVRNICDAMQSVKGFGAQEIHLAGAGQFGGNSVLWCGLGGTEGLAEIASRLHTELAKRGILTDDKPFKPHITIARRANAFRKCTPEPCKARITQIVLFESLRVNGKLIYRPIYTQEL